MYMNVYTIPTFLQSRFICLFMQLYLNDHYPNFYVSEKKLGIAIHLLHMHFICITKATVSLVNEPLLMAKIVLFTYVYCDIW